MKTHILRIITISNPCLLQTTVKVLVGDFVFDQQVYYEIVEQIVSFTLLCQDVTNRHAWLGRLLLRFRTHSGFNELEDVFDLNDFLKKVPV
jgi:hypothetical protein